MELRAARPEDTRAVGEAIAALLRPGDTVALTGDLGAGKTTLVQGAARGLGVQDHVVSPTFTLMREYRGRVPVVHVDVYRLDRVQDVLDLGLEEVVDDAVVFVEWGDLIEALLPPEHLQVELRAGGDDVRRLVVTATGGTWADRWERLVAAVGPWEVGRGAA
ncbi:MAG TPA: tRNA (adenosine(37)-N6)-threonylcarbamoyltransferase complex ATPase subunit type 1 TsaE [Actinomycetota bacterium]|nr:tRNA (adenosine(37)-N6)-threonylcarbamoyltransferase complex ATPase subunit type 1 TsaE [Actinomycetota bacterium]